jgi:type III restriction enzyme
MAKAKKSVVKVKGRDDAKQKEKRKALDLWIRSVNEDGGFGKWSWDVSFDPSDLNEIIDKHSV